MQARKKTRSVRWMLLKRRNEGRGRGEATELAALEVLGATNWGFYLHLLAANPRRSRVRQRRDQLNIGTCVLHWRTQHQTNHPLAVRLQLAAIVAALCQLKSRAVDPPCSRQPLLAVFTRKTSIKDAVNRSWSWASGANAALSAFRKSQLNRESPGVRTEEQQRKYSLPERWKSSADVMAMVGRAMSGSAVDCKRADNDDDDAERSRKGFQEGEERVHARPQSRPFESVNRTISVPSTVDRGRFKDVYIAVPCSALHCIAPYYDA
ncbi:hypothetical protein AXG93_1052s1070 [Marchantia polymorpha subsp. ruderalis]|uniref:Uncharacterized protein n=1 Tax=Marchantia polymorpha subsp. ruderalis TaxID=1480154 RepID=A0A176VU10_MARPO|nr:hypothetical protein AXG93_1052s1070 [Marchantia polymorpha subsp. ruderalis]